MRNLIVLLLIVLLVTPAFAQADPLTSGAFSPVLVSGISFHIEDGAVYLIVTGTPASCDPVFVEQWQQEFSGVTVVDVALFTQKAPDDAVCNTLLPFTQRVDLGSAVADTAYALFVNDYAASVYVPRPDANPLDVLAQLAIWDGEIALEPHFRSDAVIEVGGLSISEDNTIVVQIRGAHGDGCEYPSIAAIFPDRADENLHTLQYYRVLPLAVMCPAILRYFDETVDTGLAADQEHLLRVGETLYHYTPADQQFTEVKRAYNGIVDVIIIPVPDGEGYEVRIRAEQGGECGAPLQEIVVEKEYATLIEIFNDVAVDAACTRNIVIHDLAYTVNQLPLVINGTEYDLDEANDDQAGVGEMFPVEHVIENVEVLVLESFPMQLVLQVSGYQSDGCEVPVQVVQQVEGNDVKVQIYREMSPAATCPMMIVSYNEEIRIEGSFSGGTVNIQVNQFTTSVDL